MPKERLYSPFHPINEKIIVYCRLLEILPDLMHSHAACEFFVNIYFWEEGFDPRKAEITVFIFPLKVGQLIILSKTNIVALG